MVDIVQITKRFLNSIYARFATRSGNTNKVGLRFGRIEAMLLPRSVLLIRGKFAMVDNERSYGWVKRKGSFLLYPKSESNPHIVISGMSGFGKSTLFKSMLIDIKNCRIPCIIFDAHSEHNEAVKMLGGRVHNAIYSGINILELDGASVSERISELSGLFREVYMLGHIQVTKLSECLWYTYRKNGARNLADRELANAPTIRDLIDEINIFIRNSKTAGERNTLLRLKDRISLLNSSAFTGVSTSMNNIQNGIHSFALASMKSREAQLIYIGELLNRIYSMMHDKENNGALRLYIMIDEAQFLTDNSNSNSIISKLIEEGRKYGIGVIIVTHAASTLNKKIMANASTFLTFYAREPSEVAYIAKVLSGSDGQMADAIRNKMQRLVQNQAMLVSSNVRNPVLLSTPKFNEVIITGNSSMGEDEAKELLKSKAKKPIRLSEIKDVNKIDSSLVSKLTESGELSYLEDSYDNVEWVMWRNNSLSLEHELWVKRISEFISSKGIENMILDNSTGPDISILRNGIKIAIEYETGSKSMESTIKMMELRLKSYSRVVILTKSGLVDFYRQNLVGKLVEVIARENLEMLQQMLSV